MYEYHLSDLKRKRIPSEEKCEEDLSRDVTTFANPSFWYFKAFKAIWLHRERIDMAFLPAK